MFRLSVNGSWPLQSFSNFADVTLAVEQLSLHVDISMPPTALWIQARGNKLSVAGMLACVHNLIRNAVETVWFLNVDNGGLILS